MATNLGQNWRNRTIHLYS